MLKKIENLPAHVLGFCAEGKIERKDYESVILPSLREAYNNGQRVRFLYQLGLDFSGITPGAAFEDFRVGIKYLRLFERCAIVTDMEWIKNSTQIMGAFFPCPIKVFSNSQLAEASIWVSSSEAGAKMTYEFKENILIVYPNGPLSREDFDKLSCAIDPWIEAHQVLHGLVIVASHFPGWENVGSFIHHLEFVKSHHRKVRKVALVADGMLTEVAPQVAKHFVEADIKHFKYDRLEDALKWTRLE